MSLSRQQIAAANLIYGIGIEHGLSPARAAELVSAAWAESSLDPGNVNPTSGAAGLFQLYSPGYRKRAEELGGLHNPRANTLAILPSYLDYWKKHPNARPGEAGRDVEISGEGADFYSKGLSVVTPFLRPGSRTTTSQAPTGPVSASGDPSARASFASQLIAARQATKYGKPADYSSLLAAARASRTSPGAQVVGDVATAVGQPAAPSTVQWARTQLGVPYSWGGGDSAAGVPTRGIEQGANTVGWDCSGLTQAAWLRRGIDIGPTTYQQIKAGVAVSSLADAQPGDLLFPSTGHVLLYAGNGRAIEAPRTGGHVQEVDVSQRSFIAIRRPQAQRRAAA